MISPTLPDRSSRGVRSRDDHSRTAQPKRAHEPGRMRTLLSVPLMTVAIGVTTAGPLQADDLLIRADGKAAKVFQVTKASYDEVTFIPRKGVDEQKVERSTVRRIRFGDAPPSYANGLDALRRGDYEDAIKMLKSAQTDPKVRQWWASVWCRRYIADAYIRWSRLSGDKAKANAAIDVIDTATKEFPESFFKPDFTLMKIEASLLAAKHKDAASMADRLEKDASGWKDKTWYLRAKLLGAEALENQRLFAEAISKLDTLVTAANSAKLPTWAAEAQVRKARAILGQGNKDKALKAFQDLVSRVDAKWSKQAAAAAYVGLGQVYLEHFDKPYDARENLLTARVVHFADGKDGAETMAACAYWLGQVGEAVAKKGDASGKQEAQRYYSEIVEHYKTTSWVEKAKQGLKRVK